jgi:hypothetical protein
MLTPNNVPVDRVRIFDRAGFPLAEFNAAIDRSWTIGAEGRAAFVVPTRKTDIAGEKILQFSNWLLIENSVLPPWIGVIDTPREWSTQNKTVTVTAYTPERVFSWRRGPFEELLTGSAGAIFSRLLDYVNGPEVTIMRAGDIWRGGTQREETINPTLLNKDLERVYERSGEEYQFRPLVGADGRLTVYADWLGALGADAPIILQEGGNIEAVGNTLVEDGDIVNDLLAFGEGESWVSKPYVNVTNQESIGKYGLRRGSKEYSGVSIIETLDANGREFVARAKEPTRAYRLNAINVGDTFQYMRLGNRFTLRFSSIGFQSNGLGMDRTVRIAAMAYDTDNKNKINLVVVDD